MIKGLQDSFILASAKHFPGLGDTTIDPHVNLETLRHDLSRLENIELVPFKKAIESNVASIQTDHVFIPSIDPKYPSSLSHIMITSILKEKMCFDGLIISGALRMKALMNNYSEQEIVIRAFLAGSDILLMPKNILTAHKTIKDRLEKKLISLASIDEKVRKILKLKENLGLKTPETIAIPLIEDVNTASALDLKKTILNAVIGKYVKNSDFFHSSEPSKKIGCVVIGKNKVGVLTSFLKNSDVDICQLSRVDSFDSIQEKLNCYEKLFCLIYPSNPTKLPSYGLSSSELYLIEQMHAVKEKLGIIFFGNSLICDLLEVFHAYIIAFEEDPNIEENIIERFLLHK